jgi:hypothetical protein
MNVTSNAAPTWSAFREASFGVAGLTILNATHATFGRCHYCIFKYHIPIYSYINLLQVLIVTKHFLEWHRVACDKGFFTNNTDAAYYSYNPDPDGGQDFNDDCITAFDNSIQNMLTTDKVMIIRPSATMCPNKYAGAYRAV